MLSDTPHRFALMVGISFTLAATAALPGPVSLTLVEVDERSGGIVDIRMADVSEDELVSQLPGLNPSDSGVIQEVRTIRRLRHKDGSETVQEEITVTRLADRESPPAVAELRSPPARSGDLDRLGGLVESALLRPWIVPARTDSDLRRYRQQVEVKIRREPVETAGGAEATGYRASWFDGG